jgi:hypothetical protein
MRSKGEPDKGSFYKKTQHLCSVTRGLIQNKKRLGRKGRIIEDKKENEWLPRAMRRNE